MSFIVHIQIVLLVFFFFLKINDTCDARLSNYERKRTEKNNRKIEANICRPCLNIGRKETVSRAVLSLILTFKTRNKNGSRQYSIFFFRENKS